MEWFLMAWQKYAQFSGRSRRKEYWMFTLVNMIVWAVLYGAGMVALLNSSSSLGMLVFLACGAYALAALIPCLSVSVRRLHDTNKSGWWLLLCLIPLGGLVILVFCCIEGDPGPNQYGPSPKLLAAAAVIG
ncbi:MAG TPA: DUF805 domain-containing protein [Acidobacteriaceae bacterium]|jgi:uncharacterized membrane protein YhaH (DUF805 family)|nr:DUF805 domain-containing protein [Acidobacteriaceae bacterium]